MSQRIVDKEQESAVCQGKITISEKTYMAWILAIKQMPNKNNEINFLFYKILKYLSGYAYNFSFGESVGKWVLTVLWDCKLL